MVSFEEACQIISKKTRRPVVTESVALDAVLGRVLAAPIVASRANPAFDNSAVDGYLLGAKSAKAGDSFALAGEIRAGTLPPLPSPGKGEAVRIFTGGSVPEGDFCVAMQEDVVAADDKVVLSDSVSPSEGIRRAGSDFSEGTELAPAGARIGPAELALAAWNGLQELEVFEAPAVVACVTGDEIVQPGQECGLGQIYDSNGPMLEALVHSCGPAAVARLHLPDHYEATVVALSELSKVADLIVISGGASVGDHDHIPAAVEELGEIHFHKVSIKPGKPVLFGRIGEAMVFGLPGNPASAYVCFELFVREALRLLSGESFAARKWFPAKFDGSHGPFNRDEFQRVSLEVKDGELWAKPVFEQGSFGLRSLSGADGLARLESGGVYAPGENVSVSILREA